MCVVQFVQQITIFVQSLHAEKMSTDQWMFNGEKLLKRLLLTIVIQGDGRL